MLMSEPITNSLLIVDDDEHLRRCLAHALEVRGFKVTSAGSIGEGLTAVEVSAPAFAVVDLRLGDGCGLRIIEALKARRPDARAVIQTGYGNLATAVSAAKIGALDYLTKPADADEIEAVLLAPEGCKPEPPKHPMTANRVR
jgi:two-component system, response regulator RegA